MSSWMKSVNTFAKLDTLGLANPASEFEKDLLKALVARDFGFAVTRLFFISRAGAARKCAQPGRSALINWVKSKHQLRVEIHELGGEPRNRTRARKEILRIPLSPSQT